MNDTIILFNFKGITFKICLLSWKVKATGGLTESVADVPEDVHGGRRGELSPPF